MRSVTTSYFITLLYQYVMTTALGGLFLGRWLCICLIFPCLTMVGPKLNPRVLFHSLYKPPFHLLIPYLILLLCNHIYIYTTSIRIQFIKKNINGSKWLTMLSIDVLGICNHICNSGGFCWSNVRPNPRTHVPQPCWSWGPF